MPRKRARKSRGGDDDKKNNDKEEKVDLVEAGEYEEEGKRENSNDPAVEAVK
ncbi:hypothetical protein HYZ99_03395 [Candidatus Peregrinibacteria bacterium]|nr:hypothetical protein [Candidatus Peregrinibacteria bacterium]